MKATAVALAAVLTLMCCMATVYASEIILPEESVEATEEPAQASDSTSDGGGGIITSLLSGESLLNVFQDLFTNTINNFFSGIVNAAIGFVDDKMLDYLTGVFHAENWVNSGTSTILTTQTINEAYTFIYIFACALVALKFIFKGFQIYILWRNGDADSSPREMMVGVVEAAVVMVAFPWAYERGVDVCLYLANGIMGRLGLTTGDTGGLAGLALDVLFATGKPAETLLTILFFLVFIVMVFILWIKLLRQGFELLIMRLGVPLATLGLIDSDMALFKNYIQTFFKVALTVVIQVALMSLAFRVIMIFSFLNMFAAIALMATAMGAPHLLQQFLAPQSPGGGGMQKAYTVAMVARAAKMLIA